MRKPVFNQLFILGGQPIYHPKPPMSAHQSVLQCLRHLPGPKSCIPGSFAQHPQKRSRSAIKNQFMSRRKFHLSLSILWGEMGQRARLSRKFTGCLARTWRHRQIHFELTVLSSLQGLQLLQMLGIFSAISCP